MAAEFWTMGVGLPRVGVRQARAAEAAGWDGFLLVDSQNLAGDCYAELALAAAATTRIKLGTGVTNPYTRHPAVTASAAATVQAESGGRMVLGIGRGDSSLAHLGLAPAPVEALATYVRQVRAFLAGEEVGFRAEHAAAPVDTLGLAGQPAASSLRWLRPDQPLVPVDVYGTGPKVLALAGAVADRATMAVGADPARVSWALEVIRAAGAEAGRPDPAAGAGACVNVVCHDDPAVAFRLASGGLASFARFSVMHGRATGPLSAEQREVLEGVHRAYDMNRHTLAAGPQAEALSEDFARTYAILGPPSYCVERLGALTELGVTRFVVIGPSADAGRDEARAAVERLVGEVLPALR
ncbi:MAG TPA: LLM class flavin-dependent oxidoreductase [Acidimicrobiales bacterium]|nr:LLM class flavin-dependent oxidoreductase [Acidimicrobiales bacterium]